ncbi:MAG: hypothetical protein L3K17_02935 [Thermoplasmata archaeon]|nr:hypothetical protein [Thermoplasmata archaeon]
MTTDRQFCRFTRGVAPAASGRSEVPEDGLCLCAFVVLASEEDPHRILLGKINPEAPWDHLGALDPGRVTAWKGLWMLPSSHLIVREDPRDAAARILTELVGLPARPLEGPIVTSEVYPPRRHPGSGAHWDLEFIFHGTTAEAAVRPLDAWTELAFVDTRSLRAEQMARSHEDILAHAGHALGPRAE